MKIVKTVLAILISGLLTVPQAYAQSACPPGTTGNPDCILPPSVPEIDGSGTIIAIGLLAGLVALLRERFFRK